MKFDIETACTQEIIMGYLSLIKVHFGGPWAHIYRPPKIAFDKIEVIAMKFDIEIVCIQEIIMGIINLIKVQTRGPWTPNLQTPKILFNNIELIAMKFDIEIACTQENISLIKVHGPIFTDPLK